MKIISLMQRIVVVLMFLFGSVSLFAQQVLVRGIVKDASGEPIIGASLLEIGTTNGTVTDFDGNFELNVANNAKLQVSYLGYQTQEVVANGKAPMVVILKEDFSKALGQCLRRRLPPKYPFICLDGIECKSDDYIDIGEPIAGNKAVPVVVKTLVFGGKKK